MGLAVVGASSESASPGGWGFGSALRCDFPPVTDSGPSAALRARGRIGWGCGFRLGVVADSAITRSRSHRGRCARCRPVVRWLPRAVLCEVGEDGSDGCGFFDAGDDAHRAAAVDAGFHVDTKHALEALRLGHRMPALNGAAVVDGGPGPSHVGGWPFAAPRWRQLRAQLRV